MFSLSFFSEGQFTLENYGAIFAEARTWSILKNTVVMVTGSTVVALALGLFFAWIVAYSDFRGKRMMLLFIMIPFIIPSYIVTLSWTQLMSRNGMVATVLDVLPFDLAPFNMYSMAG
ncbi:ferric iron ABC transporter, permease protein [Bacillus sp. JCM 19046]|nr:ferric iron ABC transporter, permease protein [Bacillus sp. JCM 19046]